MNRNMFKRSGVALGVTFALVILGHPQVARGGIDESIYSSYEFDERYKHVYLTVCGSLKLSEGCYAQIPIRGFGRIGAIMEGYPSTVGNTVSRRLYVLDVEAGPTADAVRLDIYRKDDAISASTDIVSVTLETSVDLALKGGKSATAFMSANEDYLLIGTDQGIEAVRVRKGSWLMVSYYGCGEDNLSAMSADNYGNITFVQGDGFYACATGIDKNGEVFEDQATAVHLNWRNSVDPSRLPTLQRPPF